jgi:hypothetical protein
MTHRQKRLLQAAGLTLGISLVAAQPAQATLLISATIDGVDVCVGDNGAACTWGTQLTDVDPALNSIRLDPTTVGSVFLEGTAAAATFGPSFNILDSSSLRVSNTGAATTATVAISATDYDPPSFVAFVSGAGTWQNAQGSTISMEWYNDPTNAQGAEDPADRPGTLLATFTDTAAPVVPVESFATGTLGPFAVNDPVAYSMTLAFDLSLAAGTVGTPSELINRGQNVIKQVAVPEPAMLALFGAALSAGAVRLRRRRNG